MTKKNSKSTKERPLLEHGPFARSLGSVDYHTREKGLQALTLWLSKRRNIEENDMMKLWKGIFYCFWHSDKAPIQNELAERLAHIMSQLPEEVANLYFETFVMTMRREWFGIDRIRLDKYLMLVRKVFAQALQQLQVSGWNSAKVKLFSSYLKDQVLLPNDTFVAAGFGYQVVEVLLPELERVVEESSAAPPTTVLFELFHPLCSALQNSSDASLLLRIESGFLKRMIEDIDSSKEPRALENFNVAAFASHLFDLGAAKETKAKNRELLYRLSTALGDAATLAAQRAKDSSPTDIGMNGSAGKKKKKTKRRRGEDVKTEHLMPEASPVTGDEVEPLEKKKKKMKYSVEVQQETPPMVPASSKNRKKWLVAEELQNPPSSKGKNVRFALKKNLVMTIGQPPAPADIRTPPSSKPKGSALKLRSSFGNDPAPRRLDKPHHTMHTRRASTGSLPIHHKQSRLSIGAKGPHQTYKHGRKRKISF